MHSMWKKSSSTLSAHVGVLSLVVALHALAALALYPQNTYPLGYTCPAPASVGGAQYPVCQKTPSKVHS